MLATQMFYMHVECFVNLWGLYIYVSSTTQVELIYDSTEILGHLLGVMVTPFIYKYWYDLLCNVFNQSLQTLEYDPYFNTNL